MQTDNKEGIMTKIKNNINQSSMSCFYKNQYCNSATSISSRYNSPKKKPEGETEIFGGSQIQFMDDFISAKNNALKSVNTQLTHSISIKKNNDSIKKWYVLLNVVLPIVQLRKIKTHFISANTIEYLTIKGKHIPHKKASNNIEDKPNQDDSLHYIQKQINLFDHIENGFISSMNEIQALINENTKLINDYNYNRITPLYSACINGHRLIVELFLNNKADYLLKCNEESVLDAAIRFSYVDIVKVLLQKCNWPDDYIKKSRKQIKQCENKIIKEMVINWKNKKGSNIFQKCFCFS